jgi:molecular chaperone Hsp33
MLRSLGRDEVESILAEQGQVEVGCEFCGAQYRFDPVDAAQVFLQPLKQVPGSKDLH